MVGRVVSEGGGSCGGEERGEGMEMRSGMIGVL